MGDALLDLEHVLRSKKEQLSLQESNILLQWRAKAMRDFTLGFGGGSIVTWLATQRLNNLFRLNITLGTAAACGLWRFSRSVESSVEHILSLEGSQIQGELANILLQRYHNDPWVLRRLSKHFYSEEVYDDSSVDRPTLRWRFRNFFGDPATYSQSTYSEETNTQHTSVDNTANMTRTKSEPKQGNVNVVDGIMENPFDMIFGAPGNPETVPDHTTPTVPSTRKTRKERRAHRRRRRHHQEESEI